MIDRIAHLYMLAKASQEESGQEAGEGIEIVRNEPYDETSKVNKYNLPPGQYTYVFSLIFTIINPTPTTTTHSFSNKKQQHLFCKHSKKTQRKNLPSQKQTPKVHRHVNA